MPKNLESDRLIYRFFTENDHAFMKELLKDKKVCEYLPGPEIYPNEVIKRVLDYYVKSSNSDDKYQNIYLIIEKDSNYPIGYAGIQLVKEFNKYEIFYGFSVAAWGKGYGTECSIRMRDLAVELGLKELIALADIYNFASQKILEKTGFTNKMKMPLWGLELYYYEIKL